MPLTTRSAYLFTLLAAACSRMPAPETPEDPALRAGVDSAADRLLAALRANGADSLLALMADDVVLMPPDEPALQGKEAVGDWYGQFLTRLRTSSLKVTDREVFIGGEWATEVAGFEWTLAPVGGGPATIDRGSYMQVWHREADGRWLFAREVWNSTSPAASPSEGQ